MTGLYPRAPGGWLIIPSGGRSPCPHHRGLCAYSGHEPDRCPRCHRAWAIIETGTGPGDGTRQAHEDWHAARGASQSRREARRAAKSRPPGVGAPGTADDDSPTTGSPPRPEGAVRGQSGSNPAGDRT